MTQVDLEKILVLIGLPVAGAVAHHLWTRFRRRLATLRWTVSYQPMAFATQDFGWGKVDILYDGQPTMNLHMAYVQVQNASSRDLQGVRVDIGADGGTVVLRSAGQLSGSLQYFPFAPEYAAILRQASRRKLTAPELAQLAARSDFLIPVLNRGGVADFTLLLSRNDHATPQLALSCDHAGVRAKHQDLEEETLGVRNSQAQAIGVLASVVITAAAAMFRLPLWAVASIGWTTGVAAVVLGVLLVRASRALLNLAG